jgi:hypothetical protein
MGSHGSYGFDRLKALFASKPNAREAMEALSISVKMMTSPFSRSPVWQPVKRRLLFP